MSWATNLLYVSGLVVNFDYVIKNEVHEECDEAL